MPTWGRPDTVPGSQYAKVARPSPLSSTASPPFPTAIPAISRAIPVLSAGAAAPTAQMPMSRLATPLTCGSARCHATEPGHAERGDSKNLPHLNFP